MPAHFPTPSASVCAGTNIGRGARPHHHQRHTHPLHRGVLPLTVRDGACRQSPAARDRRKGADSDGVDALSGTGRSQRRRWISVRAWPWFGRALFGSMPFGIGGRVLWVPSAARRLRTVSTSARLSLRGSFCTVGTTCFIVSCPSSLPPCRVWIGTLGRMRS